MEDSTNVVAIWVGFLLPIQAVRAVLGGFLDTCDSSVGETAEFCLDFVHVEDIVIDFYCSKCHEETCGISFVSIHLGCIWMLSNFSYETILNSLHNLRTHFKPCKWNDMCTDKAPVSGMKLALEHRHR